MSSSYIILFCLLLVNIISLSIFKKSEKVKVLVPQSFSRVQLCATPRDCGTQGSFVHGILEA